MTRVEAIRNMTDEELARFLCESIKDCKWCPAKDWCYFGHNGFNDWLKEEYK